MFALSKSERVKINVLGAVPFCQLTFYQPAKVSFTSKDNVDWLPPQSLYSALIPFSSLESFFGGLTKQQVGEMSFG